MNLLMVADVSIADVIGGAERVLYEQGTRLAKKGHDVHVLTRMLAEHASDNNDINGVHEWRYRINGKTSLSFFISTMRNGRRLFESLHRKYNFGCINFHQPFSACAVCRSPAARGIRKIYTCHSLSFEEYISRNSKPGGASSRIACRVNIALRKQVERRALSAADCIIVLSRYTREKLKRAYNIAPEKVAVIPGGVDLQRFSPALNKAVVRKSLDIPEGRIFLLTVRNLVPRMGLENLITAMDQVRRKIPQAFLVIGGTGPLKPGLTAMTRRLGLDEHIRFAGFIPEALLPDYYRAADLFVLPTKELEGFGLVTLEAMASGLPVLGTPTGGTREILGRFDPALLFDDITPAAIAGLIEKTCRSILENPRWYADISRQSRGFVKNNYGWEKNIHALERLMALPKENN